MEKIEKERTCENFYNEIERDMFYFGSDLWFELYGLESTQKVFSVLSITEKKAFLNGLNLAIRLTLGVK